MSDQQHRDTMREFLDKFGKGLPYEKEIAADLVRAAVWHARVLGVPLTHIQRNVDHAKTTEPT